MTSTLWLTVLCGCVTEATTVAQPEGVEMVLVAGRAMAVITGDRERQYGPEVSEMELMQHRTGQRYSVAIESNDKGVVVFLPAGAYDITRVQTSEGPFLSIAQLASSFVVEDEPIVFVGTWRCVVDSPRYGRMVLVSMVDADAARQQAVHTIRTQYPTLAGETLTTVIPFPAETETRLYEVLPYPRYPKYFQRHVW